MAEPSKAKITITRPVKGNAEVLTRDALGFLATLEIRYGHQRRELLTARAEWQAAFEKGEGRQFSTSGTVPDIRHKLASSPAPCIEFLTTVSKEALDTAKASGANRVIADFEDASSPKFETMLEGQLNLMTYFQGDQGDHGDSGVPELAIRTRGLHLEEAHLLVNNHPMSAAFFDFGLCVFHYFTSEDPASEGPARGLPPIIYIPKLEHPAEAKLWADVLRYTEKRLELPAGTLRAGIYVETLAGVLHLDEIVAKLADNVCGLTTGKWDFVFSWVKAMGPQDGFTLPDRGEISDQTGLMQTYAAHILHIGAKYGLPVTGGVSNFQPGESTEFTPDAFTPRQAEAQAGFCGAGVAFSGLVDPVRAAFENHQDASVSLPAPAPALEASSLFAPLEGAVSVQGARDNLRLLLTYTSHWMAGDGSPVLEDKMVYLAGVEIARAQLWHWLSTSQPMVHTAGETLICDAAWLEAVLSDLSTDEAYEAGVIARTKAMLLAPNMAAYFADYNYEALVKPGAHGA